AKRPKPPAVLPGKTLAPPIRRSPFRKAIGAVVEVPATLPPKPMQPVSARPSKSAAPDAQRPRIQPKQDAPPPAKGALPVMPLPSREREELRFDALGKRIPRGDRWNDEDFRRESPVLPSSELPSPPKARRAAGPFASRLQSILDDRPEAVDRFCAAAEARAAVRGEDGLRQELSAELGVDRWRRHRLPPEQRRRLESVGQGESHPPSWRSAPLVVVFTGGEPMLRRDLVPLVRQIKELPGFRYITMLTHGGFLTEAKIEGLVAAGVNQINISMNYPDARQDRERGIPGLFERLEQTIPKMVAAGYNCFTFASMLMVDNMNDAEPLIRLAHRWGINICFSGYNDLKN